MNEWRVEATQMLRKGLGFEDIAVKLSVPVDDVRQLVRAMIEIITEGQVIAGEWQ